MGADLFLVCKIGVNCGADDYEVVACVSGAAIGCFGLKWWICVNSFPFLKLSSNLGFLLEIRNFIALATRLMVEMYELAEDIMLTSSFYFSIF